MTLRVGVIGRTGMLIRSARAVIDAGHTISFVHTGRAEPHYDAGEEDFRRLAADLGADFIEAPNLRSAIAPMAATGTDVCISVNWRTLVPPAVLDLFPHGVLNAHAGDLPRFRGNACPNWAILTFAPVAGLTVHRMTDELDAGPYLYKTSLPIDETTYVGDIYRWLDAAIPTAFVAALDALAGPGFRPQDPDVRPLRTFPRRPEDGRIVWSAPTRDVLALVRASSHPFDGAFTFLEGRDLVRVFRARRSEPGFEHLAVPGQVCLASDGNPVVATGDGLIELEACGSDGRDSAATKALVLGSLRNRLG